MRSGAGLTGRGWAMLGFGVLWCVTAGFVGQRDLWWPGLFLVLLPVLSWLFLLPGAANLGVRRSVEPDRVSVAGVAEVEVTLAPRSRALGGGVTRVRDRIPSALGETAWYGLPARAGRWVQRLRYQLRPQRRGRYRIGPLERTSGDGLGLARAAQVVPQYNELLVTPRVEPLGNLRAASGLGVAPDTTLLRTGHGSADDVLIREYHQGDDMRRIHWRSTARTGQLMVRREERARDPIATIVLDNRARGYGGHDADERFEWAVSAVASLCVHLLGDGFDVTLVFADGSLVSPPRAGPGREDVLLERLAEVDTVPTRHLRDALAACAAGAEGQLLIAILARVDAEDSAALAEASRHGRACWALLVAEDDRDLAGLNTLQATGWRCGTAGPAVGVADAWRDLGRQEAW
ncbi:MAG TPA: DUF58 domain-containing protein [Propionicimonas sp.]|nr:DUF58 domain-containing protein [Propionicimonas sp.]